MECKVSELVKRGHDQAAELKSSCGASVAQLISDLATQLDCTALALREMTKKRDADHADVLAWEKTMFKACGEDCLKSVDEKFAELQARCARLAAENAALKSAHPQPFGREMMKALDAYEKHQDETPETGMLDAFFVLRDSIRVDTTATDAFLAEVRAQGRNEGINYAASRLAAAYNHGFIGKSMSEVADVVHMILDTKEELENSTLPAADGLSGEYAEAFLEDIAAQLRKGVQS